MSISERRWIFTPAESTWPFRITKTKSRKAKARPASHSLGTGCFAVAFACEGENDVKSRGILQLRDLFAKAISLRLCGLPCQCSLPKATQFHVDGLSKRQARSSGCGFLNRSAETRKISRRQSKKAWPRALQKAARSLTPGFSRRLEYGAGACRSVRSGARSEYCQSTKANSAGRRPSRAGLSSRVRQSLRRRGRQRRRETSRAGIRGRGGRAGRRGIDKLVAERNAAEEKARLRHCRPHRKRPRGSW